VPLLLIQHLVTRFSFFVRIFAVVIQSVFLIWRRVIIPRLPCESKEAAKREPNARGYYCVALCVGDINNGTRSSRLGVGLKAEGLAP
jgi:hypothetical protein